MSRASPISSPRTPLQIRFDAFATLLIEDQALAEAVTLPPEALRAVAGGENATCVNALCGPAPFQNTVCSTDAACPGGYPDVNVVCDSGGVGVRVQGSNAVCFGNVAC
jgi:hypothetical protein